MKQILVYITIILTLIVVAGCIERPSSGIEPEPSIVYVNLSENYPSGIDTLYLGPQDTTVLIAGTFVPGYPSSYSWTSDDPDIFKIVDVGGDGSTKKVVAVGDSGQSTIISVADTENDGVKNVYAIVLKWAEPTLYRHIGNYGGHSYFLSKQPANWGAARNACIAEGGYLASVTTQNENDFLWEKTFAHTDTNVWIGASVILPLGTESLTWNAETWESGEAWDFEYWGVKTVVNSETWQQFLSMRPEDGKWENITPGVLLYLLEIGYED